jgi:hypothetical protein
MGVGRWAASGERRAGEPLAPRLAFTPLVAGIGPTLSLNGTWAWALFIGPGFSSW